ncbi:large-conductance mechanosensitive channel protein MscL [Lacticaseibacillus nasuensis]|uniref:Large-conductance mechanosensitive channel n=1 Tax=Lacticaseibacillus nasuensis JCM 17158 TaxID=1291734 RepID=A0A0R1JGJ9_9LACO|nr:large-conductance mechanosensitive channel protein MscL [Lacticaseibacillus nasuensis]KRK70432.1 large-conductance mechanosensitive channel [Lacticaseibacillus nasuensis JCM 17158]MCX2454528.1 large-conductance mechanosensitive channel protein MscL [Lacticaseibacillus nasuensis]
MLKEFKQFIMRGNVLDMAVGIIIGSAFTGLVTSLTKNLINPIIGVFTRSTNLSSLAVTVLGAKFTYGQFIADVINFLIVAFVVFLLVKAANRLLPRPEAKAAAPSPEVQLLTEIRDNLKRD